MPACRWALQGTNLAVTALLGEWLCMQKEMQDIPLTSLRRNGGGAAAGAAGGHAGSSGGGGMSGGIGRSLGGGGRGANVNVMELSSIAVTQHQASKDWAPLSPLN